MTAFTDQELDAAVEAVSANVLAPYNLSGMAYFFVKDAIHGFVRRQIANALTAAAQVREQQKGN